MKDKGNKRKRYFLLGILAALALALGIERCAEDEKDFVQEHSEDKYTSSSKTDTVGRLVTSDSLMSQQIKPFTTNRKSRYGKKNVFSTIINTTCDNRLETAVSTENASFVSSIESTIISTPIDTIGESPSSSPIAAKQEENIPTFKSHRFQQTHLFRLGIHAGAGFSKITGLGSIVEGYNVRPTFTMEESGGFVPQIGIFGTWQYGRLGAEANINYIRLSSKITEHKNIQDVTETTRFHHHFITPQILLRFYAFPMFYMGAGISMAIPLGNNGIDYTSSHEGQVYQQQVERTQDHLRETLEVRTLFSPTLKLGYVHLERGLELGLEYRFGLNDLLQTRPNDYGYQERKNNVHHISLTIGYSIPLNKKKETL